MAQQGAVSKAKIKDGLTPKQAKFVKGIAEGKSATQAALSAYDVKNYGTAAVVATENLNKPNIREAVQRALEHHQLTPEMALEPVKKALLYKGDTERESLEMNLKGVGIYQRLLAMTEDKTAGGGGNTFIFNNKVDKQSFTAK